MPFRLIATATRLPRFAASFWLDALLVPALSSRHRRGAVRHFQPTDATQSLLLSTSLHPCSRRSTDFPESPPFRSRNPPLHAGELALAGPRDRSSSSSPDAVVTIFASDVSVVIPLRALRPRSRTITGLNHRGHSHRRAVTLTPISLARRRLPSESIRAPLPFGRSRAPRGGDSSRISDTSRITPLRCDRWSLFAFVGSRSVLLRVRCSHSASSCPRHAGPPCSEPPA